jgi:hypothetical protein
MEKKAERAVDDNMALAHSLLDT